jgi:pimeloyl-ACP methyl ester carboxylesterase
MANFLLIHGAMHGGWCWERIVPLLESHGHTVIAPDLPGLGADATPAAQVTLPAWGRFVAELLQSLPGKTILAGHSLGGMAISQAAEVAPERISALVYVTALLPRSGVSAFDLTRGEDVPDRASRLQLLTSPDGQYVTAEPENARAYFYGDTDRDWAERAMARLVPQPRAVMQAPAALSAARFGALPRVYVECLRDRAIPLALQRRMQAAAPCNTVLEIDTDHSPFYSAPAALAAHLQNTALRYG